MKTIQLSSIFLIFLFLGCSSITLFGQRTSKKKNLPKVRVILEIEGTIKCNLYKVKDSSILVTNILRTSFLDWIILPNNKSVI
jgi:hypothetical protein